MAEQTPGSSLRLGGGGGEAETLLLPGVGLGLLAHTRSGVEGEARFSLSIHRASSSGH